MKGLKLYVWKVLLHNYTCGVAFAIAKNPEDARILIKKDCDYIPENEIDGQPAVYDYPVGFAIFGGG